MWVSAANALLNLGSPVTQPKTELPFQKCVMALHQSLGNYKVWLLQRGKHVFKNAGDRCHPTNFVEGIFEEGIRRIVVAQPVEIGRRELLIELRQPLYGCLGVGHRREIGHRAGFLWGWRAKARLQA